MFTTEQKKKLDSLVPEQLNEQTLKDLISAHKVIKGDEGERFFEYEYDDVLDEEEHVNIALSDFQKIAPTIINTINGMNGGQMFKAMEGNKWCKNITNEKMYDAKNKEIEENTKLSIIKKQQKLKVRKAMRKEYLKLKEEGGKLNGGTCWKLWHIYNGQVTKEVLLDNWGEEKLEKNLAKVEYLGEDFINKCKEIAYPDDDEE